MQAAGRHQCSYLINLQKGEFILQGGDPSWLRGLKSIPGKLQDLYEINKILAHRPWLLNKTHIEVSFELNFFHALLLIIKSVQVFLFFFLVKINDELYTLIYIHCVILNLTLNKNNMEDLNCGKSVNNETTEIH